MGLEPTTLALGGPRATIAPTGRLLLDYGDLLDSRVYTSLVLGPGTPPTFAFAERRPADASAAQVGRLTFGVCPGQMRGLCRLTRAVACGLSPSMRSLCARWMLRVWWKETSERTQRFLT